jgi:RHS repeat-associated protein/uncharacterized repeat protein (TIGR01451 family)
MPEALGQGMLARCGPGSSPGKVAVELFSSFSLSTFTPYEERNMGWAPSRWFRRLRRNSLALFDFRSRGRSRQRGRSLARPTLEALEDRILLAVLDLRVSSGESGAINGAIFTGSTGHNTSGSGSIGSFVRLDNTGIEQGYNTDARPYSSPNDAGSTSSFNHSLQLSTLPITNKGGVLYYEFILDLNQKQSDPYISLDELRLYVSPSNTLNSYDPSTGKLAGLSPVYDMDSGLDPSDLTSVKLNSGLAGSGSGSYDMFLDVPVKDFPSDTSEYVYLYSKFGVQHLNDQILGGTTDAGNGGSANGGYEEWAHGIGTPIQISGSITTTIFNGAAPAVSPISPGSVVHDTAAITFTAGNPVPTGTVTYEFFTTLNGTGSHTDYTVTLNSDGSVPDSPNTAALAAGSYSYVAVYNGDSHYAPATGDVEPLVAAPLSSSVATVIKDAANNGTPTDALGESVYDTSTVSGNGNIAPTGSITYYFYTNSTATGTPIYQRTFALGSNSDTQGPLAAGSYSFVAVYGGDSNYSSSTGPIETLTINKGTLTLTTTIHNAANGSTIPLNSSQPLGTSAYDTVSISGSTTGFAPDTSKLSFTFNGAAAGSGSATSSTEGPMGAGGYTFDSSFAGDSNYNPASSADEPFTIAKGTITVTTTIDNDANDQPITGSVPQGTSVHDHATFSGATAGFTPTLANISYTFHNTIDASDSGSAAGSGGTSTVEGPLSAGNYSFTAHFSGDSNYNAADASVEPLVVTSPNNPNLVLTKTGNGTVNSTDTVTFTITLSNIGPVAAANVNLNDPLPDSAHLAWTIASSSDSTATISGGTLSDAIGSLASGASVTIVVSAATPSGYHATLDNTATATSSNNTPGSISASAEDIVLPPSLSVTKTPDAATVNSTDTVGFTITVSNASGAGSAYGVVLSDTLPDSSLPWTTNAGTINGGVLTDSIGSLLAGHSATVHVSAATPSGYHATLNNTATATSSNGAAASGSGSETVLAPSLSVTKTPDAATVSAGGTAGFTITVSNASGAGTAYSVVLSDTLPDSSLPWTTDAGSISGGVLTDTIGDLSAGHSATVHVSAVTPAGYSGTLNNTATATPANGASASSSASETVVPPLHIAGTVFVDANANGLLDSGEAGLGGVTLTLHDAFNNFVATQDSASDGSYRFDGLVSGAYTVVETVLHCYGTSTPSALPVDVGAQAVDGQDFGLIENEAWQFFQTGGSSSGMGSMTLNPPCEEVIHVGDSFAAWAQRSFVIPNRPQAVTFTYEDLSLNTPSAPSIKDAFEVALVDASGNPLVPTYTGSRDSFFNITDSLPAALGHGVTENGTQLTIDISQLAPGTQATIIVRLVNDDGASTSSVRLGALSILSTPAFLYHVPGAPGDTEMVTFKVTATSAEYADELGFNIVDDSRGRINNLLPGQAGFAQAALQSTTREVVFPQGLTAGEQEIFWLPAGTYLMPFLVQNSTTLSALQNNPNDQFGTSPHTFWSASAGTPDQFSHFQRTDLSNPSAVQYAVEDQDHGGDLVFNDLVFTIASASANPLPKFNVVDADSNASYAYSSAGDFITSSNLAAGHGTPMGIVSNRDGNRRWVMTADKSVSLYDGRGNALGSWQATDVGVPEGIATDGTNIWIIDASQNKVLRYSLGALRYSGTATADASFSLDAANNHASDLTTDGTNFWVSDVLTGQVFVYTMSGSLLGQWRLDPANSGVLGITLNPAGGSDLWAVDIGSLRVYHYANGRNLLSGNATATDSFPLSAAQTHPHGISDPVPCCDYGYGSNASSQGTDYWLAFPGNGAGGSGDTLHLKLTIAAEQQDVTGTVTIPGLNFSTGFFVAAGTTYTVDNLPSAADLGSGSDVITNLGIHVVSDNPVVIDGLSQETQVSEGYLGLPTQLLGTDYVVLTYKNTPAFFPTEPANVGSQLAVVASQDNTVVSITPSDTTGTHAAGVTYDVTLNQGQTYQLVDDNLPNALSGATGDLSGSIVEANKPIAVYGSHQRATVPDGGNTVNYLVEEMWPTQDFGTSFAITQILSATYPGGGTTGNPFDVIRVAAASDNTQISVNGSVVATRNRGQFWEQTISGPESITASKPVLVAQYQPAGNAGTQTGFAYTAGPFMALMPSTSEFLDAYTVREIPTMFVTRATLMVPADDVGALTVDGQVLPGSQYYPIGDSGLWGAGVTWGGGAVGGTGPTHQLAAPEPFGLIMSADQASYSTGYPAGMTLPADAPPIINYTSPANGSEVLAGSQQLLTGFVQSGGSPIVAVTVNGKGVDVLDAAGNFFTNVPILPGDNTFTAMALDALGHTTSAILTLEGVQPGPINFDLLSDVTASMTPSYARTSQNAASQVLYADMAVTNAGQYPIDTPLLVEVKNISEPNVVPRNYDGRTPDGTPYYDYSTVTGGLNLATGASTGAKTLAFYDPDGAQFTYQLVFLAQLTSPPTFTSEPVVTAAVGRTYHYTAVAVETNGDPITYSLITAPSGMTINGTTGQIAWNPATADRGSYPIDVRASDPLGGTADQLYTLSVIVAPPNRPPLFTSIPTNTAFVNTAYSYTATGSDPDADPLTFALTNAPAGMTINSTTGVFSWTPTATQVGMQSVTMTLSDGQGGVATQTFVILVGPQPGDHAPLFETVPTTHAVLSGQTWYYMAQALDADGDTVTYSASGASNLQINSSTGALTWQPSSLDTSATITVTAADGRGAIATQTFTVTVDTYSGNGPGGGGIGPGGGGGIGPGGGQATLISGVVYQDSNDNGTREASEPGLAGWTVFLDQNGNTRLDGDEVSTTTAADGSYSFSTNLAAGNYLVRVQRAAGWIDTGPANGVYALTLTDGQQSTGNNFGVLPAAASAQPSPHIASTAPSNATAGVVLRYPAWASDPNGDLLTWDVPVHPDGMVVDATAGIVVWQPQANQVGVQNVILRVRDAHGGVDLQAFTITVAAIDTSPIITSTLPTTAYAGLTLEYAVHAQDAENETLTYTLDFPPIGSGMSLDPATGLLDWSVPLGASSPQSVTLHVSDGTNNTYQTFALTVVSSNVPSPTPPTFVTKPRTTLQLGRTYVYLAQATDALDEPVRYSLSGTYPSGITVNAVSGLITWTPTPAQIGLNVVKLVATNSSNLSTIQVLPLRVLSVMGNQPPRIVSTPRLTGAANQQYQYNVRAVDPDNDTVGWHLEKGPAGMSISPTLGTLAWQPQSYQTGSFNVVVRATDAQGTSAYQSFTVTIAPADRPPIFDSTPLTTGAVDFAYSYLARAQDADDDPLTYSLASAQAGMIINPTLGLVRWTPTAAGTYTVAVAVSDGNGGSAIQQYQIVVGTTAPDRPPNITSAPTLFATTSHPYSYLVMACSPDGDAITFVLRQAPDGMTITQTTDSESDPAGLIQWTPTVAGNFPVIVSAVDSGGQVANQAFNLVVRGNTAPYINPPDVTTVVAPNTFAYDIRAFDNEGDPITYTLQRGPMGMTLDSRGRLRWPTTTDMIGSTYQVIVMVSDPYGASTTHSFNVTVEQESTAPIVTVLATPERSTIGSNVQFILHASDAVAVVSEWLTVADEYGWSTEVPLDGKGVGNLVLPHIGYYTATGYATNPVGLQGTGTLALSCYDPNDPNAPQVKITSPAADADVTGPINIVGTAYDPSMHYYELTADESVLGGNEGPIIELGTYYHTSVQNGVLGTFDPTLLPDGSYRIRLVAQNNSGLFSSTEVRFDVTGNLKLGNFKVSFTDLTVPVAGIPITITRNYDTLNTDHQGDFGYGWKIGYGTELTVNLAPTLSEPFGDYPPMSDGSRVYVTLPDGTRAGYTFAPIAYQYLFQTFYAPYFQPDPGVMEALSIPDAQDVQLMQWEDQYVTIESSGLNTFNPQDPIYGGVYTLTTLDGTKTTIDATTGQPVSIENRRGNKLTFAADGIYSNTGRAVTFERDSQGRIAAITDPRGNSVKYSYSAAGDLVSVTDRMDDPATTFTYLDGPGDPAHYLQAIIDGEGNQAVVAKYGSDSRLSSLQDAASNPLDLNYDPGHLKETSTDPADGASTTTTFDAQGNPTQVQDSTGALTIATYNADNEITSDTQVVSSGNDLTTSYAYDQSGDVTKVTTPDGQVTRMTYDTYGDVQSMTDSQGSTSSLTFDDKGNLIGQLMPDGQTFQATYDAHGDPVTMSLDGATGTSTFTAEGYIQTETNPDGVTTSKTYDANGNETSTSSNWVNPDNPNDVRPVTTSTQFDANDRPTAHNMSTGTTLTQYDALGRPVRTTDPFGLVTETTYDSRGLVIQTRSESRDQNGNVAWLITRTVYDAEGRPWVVGDQFVEGTTDPVFATRYTYDADGQTIKTERLTNVVVDITGSGSNLESQVASVGSLVWSQTNNYDTLGRPTNSTDRYGSITQSTYDSAGRLIETRTQVRDANDNLVWQVIRTVYDDQSQPVVTTDPFLISGDGSDTILTTTITGKRQVYDLLGREIETQTLSGLVVNIVSGESVLSQQGTVTSQTRTSYDSNGRVAETVDASGGVMDYEYDSQGRVTATIDSAVQINGVLVRNRTETVYDAYGHVRVTRSNIAQHADGTLDRSHEQDTTYSYDQNGNLTKTTFADGSSTQTQYDAFGRPAAETDPMGNVTNYQYTASTNALAAVQLPQVPDPENNNQLTSPTTQYRYDAQGNLVSIRDALGNTTSFTYDARGHELTRTLPDGETESFTYCGCGRQILHISFEGMVTENVYDDRPGAGGRLSQLRIFASVAAYNNGQGTPDETIAYTYDGFGRVIQVTDTTASGQQAWTSSYDAFGRVLRKVSPQGAVNYEYDPQTGWLTRTFTGTSGSYSGDQTNPVNDTRYQYDVFGRLTQVKAVVINGVTLAQPEVTSYAYDLLGNLIQKTTPDGVISVYAYDALNRLVNLTEYLPVPGSNNVSNNPKLAEFDYVRRADGKQQSATETFWFTDTGSSTPTAHQNVLTIQYDADGHLTQEVIASYNSTIAQTQNFTWDLAGNRLAETVDMGNHGTIDQTVSDQYNGDGQLVVEQTEEGNHGSVEQTTVYGYTGSEQTSQTVHQGDASGPTTEAVSYAYNLEGRMSQVVDTDYTGGSPSRVERVTFGYAPFGDRVSILDEVDADGDGTFETRTQTNDLVDTYNPTGYAQVVQETATNIVTGSALQTVVYTVGLEVISQTTFVPGGPTAGATLVLHSDGDGSTRLLTNLGATIAQAQGVLQIYHYDGFGNALGFNPATALTTLLYRGQRFDSVTGLQYLRARYYDPRTGEFTQLDPVFGEMLNPRSMNKYGYADGDPVNGWDPTGMFVEGDSVLSAQLTGNLVKMSAPQVTVGYRIITLLKWLEGMLKFGNAVAQYYLTARNVNEWFLAAQLSADVETQAATIAQAATEAKTQNDQKPFDEMMEKLAEEASQLKKDKCDKPPILINDLQLRNWIGVKVAGGDTPKEGQRFKDSALWAAFQGSVLPDKYEKEHIVPYALFGPNWKTNMVPLKESANARASTLERDARRAANQGCIIYVKIEFYVGDPADAFGAYSNTDFPRLQPPAGYSFGWHPVGKDSAAGKYYTGFLPNT